MREAVEAKVLSSETKERVARTMREFCDNNDMSQERLLEIINDPPSHGCRQAAEYRLRKFNRA